MKRDVSEIGVLETNHCVNCDPFTATLAAMSLLKLPIRVPNLRSLMPSTPPPPPQHHSHEQVKGFLPKCTVLQVDLLSCHQTHCMQATLQASLSGTFLQTLPDLVTPLKGHSLSPRSRRGQRPPKGLGTDTTVKAT